LNSLVVIIVNYKTCGLVIDCLRSLADEIIGLGQVIIVDNGSHDESPSRIANTIATENWGDRITLIQLPNNLGFSAGNNIGIRLARKQSSPPCYYLLLNPDTIVRPGAFKALLQFMSDHPTVGIAGSRLENSDGTPQRSAFRFPSLLGELEGSIRLGIVSRLLHRSVVAPPVRNRAHPTDWVAGASMMIRREVMDQIGLLDERYFLYFEEVDYCRNARRAGWQVWYVPTSRVIHFVGQSTGVTGRNGPKRVPQYWFASRQRYFNKNHGATYAALASLAWASGFAFWRVRRWFQRKPDNDPPKLLSDFINFHFRRASAGGEV
jgi:GT2 family glycosyltransferase